MSLLSKTFILGLALLGPLSSHASLAAKEFFDLCQQIFPFEFKFVLTDNGSEFKKHFESELRRLHMIHYHTYPKTPKMNAHLERFNRTIQEEFIDYRMFSLLNIDEFNNQLIDYLLWYNTERVHYAFQNKLSPIQFMIQWLQKQPESPEVQRPVCLSTSMFANMSPESKIGWHHTNSCKRNAFMITWPMLTSVFYVRFGLEEAGQ